MVRFEEMEYEIGMDEWIDGEEEYKEFAIENAQTADWAISQIAEERRRKDYFVDCAKAEIEKLNNQIKDAESKCERATDFLTSCLGRYLEREDVPAKETKTQVSIKLPAGQIIKKLPKTEYVMADGSAVTKSKDFEAFVKEVKAIDKDMIKTKEEVDWASLKKTLTTDDNGGVFIKDTGEYIETLSSIQTLPSIEIKVD